MRLSLVLLALAASAEGARLRNRNAATLLATVKSTTASAAEKADCVESAKNGIKQVYEDVDEVQKMIDGLPDGSECKLDVSGITKAKNSVSKLEQDIQGAKKAVEQAESADAPCCKLALSDLVAAKDEGAFPQGLKCAAMTDALKTLDKLRSTLTSFENSMPGKLQAVTDANEAAERALNACICKAADTQIRVFDSAEGKNSEKLSHRSKTIMLNKQVICAQENAGAGGDADKCDSEKLALTKDEKKQLTLTKPKMAVKCIREPPAKCHDDDAAVAAHPEAEPNGVSTCAGAKDAGACGMLQYKEALTKACPVTCKLGCGVVMDDPKPMPIKDDPKLE